MAEPHGHRRAQPADDVEEVEAWCRGCDAVRTFRLQHVDVSDVELRSSTVNVRRALEGERAWVCGHCGAVRFRLADESAYDLALANRRAVLGNPPEVGPGGGIVRDSVEAKVTGGDAMPHEPATEPHAVHADAAVDAVMEAQLAEDVDLAEDAERVRSLAAQERGEEPLGLEHGPRRGLPPPARVPPRDPSA
jgi:hypothetical protein